VNTSGDQTIAGTKTFSSAVELSTAGTTTTQAVRADRTITTGTGITGGGNLTANRTFAIDIATQAEAEAGTDNTKVMTPLRAAQAIAAQGGAPTTAQVLDATAGASAGAVGTYAWLGTIAATTTDNFGDTRAGSELRPVGYKTDVGGDKIETGSQNLAQSGAWRCMGFRPSRFGADTNNRESTLWLRIS
jgi:hypothetical protein